MSGEHVPEAQGPEKSILSTMMKSPGYIAKAQAEGLTAAHFHRPANATLFAALIGAGEFELIGFVEDLHRLGKLDEVGGAGNVSDIYTYAPNSCHWADHIRRLREALFRRQILSAAQALEGDAPVAEVEDLQKTLARASESAADALRGRSRLMSAQDAASALVGRMRAIAEGDDSAAGWATGLQPIDLVTGGARPGQLWVVAGETSGGKSVALLQAAQQVSEAGGRVLIVSLEMETWEVMARMVSCRGSIPLGVLMDPGKSVKFEIERAKRTIQDISAEKMAIDDEGGRSVPQIEAMAIEFGDTHGGIDMIVVDYVQLLDSPRKGRNDTRESELSAASKGLKAMAKKFKCPVMTASQLNDGGRLRESRAIGHDADVVLCIEEEGIRGVKIRNAPRGQLFPLVLNGDKQRFEQTHGKI